MSREENRAFITLARYSDMQARDCQQLIGICQGLIADNDVNQKEAEFLLHWLKNNPEIAATYPANILTERLVEFFEDGIIDDEESKDLLEILHRMTGEGKINCDEKRSISLGFDDPAPSVCFIGEYFCLTGEFREFKRRDVERILTQAGAFIKNNVLKTLPMYLVVGELCTAEWKFSNYGRKIEKAMAYRDEGYPIKIIPEKHMWSELDKIAGVVLDKASEVGKG